MISVCICFLFFLIVFVSSTVQQVIQNLSYKGLSCVNFYVVPAISSRLPPVVQVRRLIYVRIAFT